MFQGPVLPGCPLPPDNRTSGLPRFAPRNRSASAGAVSRPVLSGSGQNRPAVVSRSDGDMAGNGNGAARAKCNGGARIQPLFRGRTCVSSTRRCMPCPPSLDRPITFRLPAAGDDTQCLGQPSDQGAAVTDDPERFPMPRHRGGSIPGGFVASHWPRSRARPICPVAGMRALSPLAVQDRQG